MRPMFYGAILIISILFLPNGLESLLPKIKSWFAGRKERRDALAEQPVE
jgi:branched-chain amino acid transport system permease protein